MDLRRLRTFAIAAGLPLTTGPVRGEEKVVLPFETSWDWLMILEPGSAAQVDPVLQDPDFLETWTTADYDGPAFQTGAAPLSYGGLAFLMNGSAPPGTELSTPALGTRGTVYFRTTFDLPGPLTNVKLEYLIDDGFILYLDGDPFLTVNMPAGATSAFGQLASVVSDEASIATVETGAVIPPGHHTLHLSVHNTNVISSDLGFMLRLTGELQVLLSPTLAVETTAPSLEGTPRFKLRATQLDPAIAVDVEESADLMHWTKLFTSPATAGRTEFALDLPATADQRYFRLAQ